MWLRLQGFAARLFRGVTPSNLVFLKRFSLSTRRQLLRRRPKFGHVLTETRYIIVIFYLFRYQLYFITSLCLYAAFKMNGVMYLYGSGSAPFGLEAVVVQGLGFPSLTSHVQHHPDLEISQLLSSLTLTKSDIAVQQALQRCINRESDKGDASRLIISFGFIHFTVAL